MDPSLVALAPFQPYVGVAWRHLSPQYPPLSGEGARIRGGRFNRPASYPDLYLCRTRPCVVAELQRLGARQGVGLAGLPPRHLYRYEVSLSRVLDLSSEETRGALAIGAEVLTGPDWTVCQELGTNAHALGVQAILAPSATGVDQVLAVFVQHLELGVIEPQLAEVWHSPTDLEDRGPNDTP